MRLKNIDRVPKPNSAKMFDVPIGEMQTTLKDNLPWLDYSFGRAQILIKDSSKKHKAYSANTRVKYPGVHLKNGEYTNVLPCEEFRDFSFFLIHDRQEIKSFEGPRAYNIEAEFSLIFWLDTSGIFANSEDRNTELIKAEVLKVLNTKVQLSNARIKLDGFSEQAENIYKEFDIDELETQYLMFPFYGLRIDGTITLFEKC